MSVDSQVQCVSGDSATLLWPRAHVGFICLTVLISGDRGYFTRKKYVFLWLAQTEYLETHELEFKVIIKQCVSLGKVSVTVEKSSSACFFEVFWEAS